MSKSRSRLLLRATQTTLALAIGCVCLLLVGLALDLRWRRGAAGKPSLPISVSAETTRITGPLRADGYVDFVAALNAEQSAGVQPENNAAVALLEVTGPGRIERKLRDEFFAQLGIPAMPALGSYLRPRAEFEAYGQTEDAEADDTSGELDTAADDQADSGPLDAGSAPLEQMDLGGEEMSALDGPWSAAQYPRLAAWLAANEAALDRAVAASRKAQWYSPQVRQRVIWSTSPQVGDVDRVTRQLAARAMLRTHDGNFEGAWQDLLACHRFGRLVAQGPLVHDWFVGTRTDLIACQLDRLLVYHGQLSATRLRSMHAELAALPPWGALADRIDRGERFSFLELAAAIAADGPMAIRTVDSYGSHFHEQASLWQRSLNGLGDAATDWNAAARLSNQYFDRTVAALRQPDASLRNLMLSQIDAELGANQWLALPEWSAWRRPRQELGNRAGLAMCGLLLPRSRILLRHESRALALFEITRLSFALAAFRADHGHYPASLTDLVPRAIGALPSDPFTDRPFVYRRTLDGYLLYSVGANGVDEQGPTTTLRGSAAGDDLGSRVPPPSP